MNIDERVRAELERSTRFGPIEVLLETDSTNRVVAERAAGGAPEGLVVVADHQTAGRGRLGRTWEARPGDALLVSVLIRPTDLPRRRWHLVTAAAGLAAADACSSVAGFRPDLKWPNDLLWHDRKVAGILAEAAGESVVVGMGLNVHAAPPDAAWVDDAARRRVERSALLVSWLTAMDALLRDWDDLAAAYRRRCATVGLRVRVDLGGGDSLTGLAEAIDADGRLLVRAESDGRLVEVAAGDVVHLRPA